MALPLYFHPTTVCFIDDNSGFLRALTYDLPDAWTALCYLSPEAALAAINRPHPALPLVNRCFSVDHSSGTGIIHLDLQTLGQEIKRIDRFKRVSVLMIDYSMPTMNGLQLCAAIEDTDIKKALLTGVADEKTAVAAFNEGLIDRYIPKASLAEANYVIEHVEDMQQTYFDQFTQRLNLDLADVAPSFMYDPEVEKYVRSILHEHDIAEYYLVNDPFGYLLLKADGTMLHLVIASAQDQAEHIALAKTYGAPQEIVQKLTLGSHIGFFYEHPRDYLNHEPYNWHDYIVPAQLIESRQRWFVGLATNPPTDIDFDAASTSYAQYLRMFNGLD